MPRGFLQLLYQVTLRPARRGAPTIRDLASPYEMTSVAVWRRTGSGGGGPSGAVLEMLRAGSGPGDSVSASCPGSACLVS